MNATLHGHWQSLVATAPDALALIDAPDERRWSRADLAAHVATFRQRLPAGVARQRVTFALPNGPDWLALFIALLEAGATPVPLDPAEPADAQRVIAEAVGAGFAWIGGELTTLDPKPRRRGPAPALIKLTSGSTGRPRALGFTHAQMLADGRQVCAGMGIRPDDLNLAVIPFGHSYGLGNLVVPLLAQGTPCVCADLPLPHALAALVARHHPTVFPTVPALLRVLAAADLPGDALAPLRTVISAGAPLGPEMAVSFFSKYSVKPHGFYGSSETGGISYDRDGDDTLAGAGVGVALPGVTIAAARGGRIRVTSAAVRGGSFSPADRAQIDADGRVVLRGRAGRLVKIAGRRLDLGDLENTLRGLPGVGDAFVATHPDDAEQLAAVIATKLTAAELRALLKSRLAAWKVPRRVVPLAEFPLTARGKTDTAALRELLKR